MQSRHNLTMLALAVAALVFTLAAAAPPALAQGCGYGSYPVYSYPAYAYPAPGIHAYYGSYGGPYVGASVHAYYPGHVPAYSYPVYPRVYHAYPLRGHWHGHY